MARRLCFQSLVLFIVLLGVAITSVKAAPPPAAEMGSYHLKSGDVVTVTVWGEQDLSGDLLIGPDGSVSLPLVGNVTIGGMNANQAAKVLKTHLRKYVPDADVAVALKKVGGNMVYVIGKVARPGGYLMDGKTTVLQALSLAGGLNVYADGSDIRVIRDQGQRQTAIAFDYAEVIEGQKLEQNIALKNGDVIAVP